MAFKSAKNMTLRNQGTLVGNIKNLISSRSEFFPVRPRKYLKEILQIDGSVYWLSQGKEVTAIALVEPKYRLQLDGLSLVTVGHIIGKTGYHIDSVLTHVLGDNSEHVKIIFMKPNLARSLDLEYTYRFIGFSPLQLLTVWPALANLKTDYFNSTEILAQSLDLRKMNLYLRVETQMLTQVQRQLPLLVDFLVKEKSS